MGLFSSDIATMDDLFLHVVQDVYYAEQQIAKSLPKMIAKATDSELRDGLSSHLRETNTHVTRLETVFGMIGRSPKGVDCPAIDGILKEANEILAAAANEPVLGAAIVAAAQAVEHYEITRYGTLIAWANEMGRADIANVFEMTLAEEYAADDKLTKVAEARLNRAA